MFFKGKRVVVTGCCGLIGANLVNRLAEEGANVRAVWHNNKPNINLQNVEYVKADLMAEKDCQMVVKGAEYVVIAHASTFGCEVLCRDPLAFLNSNIISNAQMLEACYKEKVNKVLWYSSTTGYPVADYPVREEEFFNGDVYWKYEPVGHMKRMTETICKIYSHARCVKPNMSCLVIRPTNIYGRYDKFGEDAHVLGSLIRKVCNYKKYGGEIEVWGSGNEVRDLIHIDDFCDASLLALQRVDTYDPITVGCGIGISVNQLLKLIMEIEDCTDASIVYKKDMPTTIPFRLVDISKAKSLLGWEPKISLRDGIKKTITWYRNNYSV